MQEEQLRAKELEIEEKARAVQEAQPAQHKQGIAAGQEVDARSALILILSDIRGLGTRFEARKAGGRVGG